MKKVEYQIHYVGWCIKLATAVVDRILGLLFTVSTLA
jgi:hypothetical protein